MKDNQKFLAMFSPTKASKVANTREQAIANYGTDPYFTIKWHHGGEFVLEPQFAYVNGKVSFSDFCYVDTFSMNEVNNLVEGLGYDGLMYYLYRVPGSKLPCGLKALGGDLDLQDFLNYSLKVKLMEVYIEHGKTVIHRHSLSPWSKCNVVIREVDDSSRNSGDGERASGVLQPRMLTWHNTGDVVIDIEAQDNPLDTNQMGPSGSGYASPSMMGREKGPYTFTSGPMDYGGDEEDESSESSSGQYSSSTTDYGSDEENESDEQPNEAVQGEEMEYEEHNFNPVSDEQPNVDPKPKESTGAKGARKKPVRRGGTKRKAHDKANQPFTFVTCGYEGSDYADSDGHSVHSSDDERLMARGKGKLPEFNPDTDLQKPEFFVKQRFACKEDVLKAINRYAICTRRDLKKVKNDNLRVRAVCQSNFRQEKSAEKQNPGDGPEQVNANVEDADQVNEDANQVNEDANQVDEDTSNKVICPFVLQVTKLCYETDWQVKTFNPEHNCNESRRVKSFTSEAIAKEYVTELVRTDPDVPIATVMNQVMKASELDMSKYQAYRSRVKAKEMVFGNYSSQYGLLWDYIGEVKRSNPDTTMELVVEDPPVPDSNERPFKRLYVCFGALKAGWKAGCRRFIGVDGCFLKGPYPQQLLSAVGIDGNDGIYPIAWAVVEKETKETWKWFLELLSNDLDILPGSSDMVIMSDMQKGLDKALEELLPGVNHRYCMYHLVSNYKKSYKGLSLKHAFENVSNATNIKHYEKNLSRLEKMDKGAHQWVISHGTEHFCKALFKHCTKCDITNNNNCESWNSMILKARDKPIVSLLENIRNIVMERIGEKKIELTKWRGPVCGNIQTEFEKVKKGANFQYAWNGGTQYELRGNSGEQYIVDLSIRECTCGVWQVTGIPCKHAVVAIRDNARFGGNANPDEWIDASYRIETQRRIYSHIIMPINGSDMWEHREGLTTITPPPYHVPAGRPAKVRRRDPDEQPKRQIKCRKCGNIGHNSRKCRGQGAPPALVNTREASNSARGESSNRGASATTGGAGASVAGRGNGRGAGRGSTKGAGRGSTRGGGRGVARGAARGAARVAARGGGRGNVTDQGIGATRNAMSFSQPQESSSHVSQPQPNTFHQSQPHPATQTNPKTWQKGGRTVTHAAALEQFRDSKRRALGHK